MKYATIDGTVWPVGLDDVEWNLRYGPTPNLYLASIVQAYEALIDPTIPQYIAIAKLKRARRAAVEALDA